MMKVTDILAQTNYSCDFRENDWTDPATWLEVIQNKACDEGFWPLIDSIVEHGITGAIGWNDGEITEGHHRLAAAILLCLDEIPVSSYGQEGTTPLNAHGPSYGIRKTTDFVYN